MDSIDKYYYKNLHIDIPTKVKLSFCKTRYAYFIKLFNYVASIRKYFSEDYISGYNDVKERYLKLAKSDKNDLDSLYPLLISELKGTSTRKITRHIRSTGSYAYRFGKVDALNDIDYCIDESKQAFMKQISEQLRKKK